MAKKKDESLDVDEALGKAEQFVVNNQKRISLFGGGAVLLIVAFLGYQYFISEPAEIEASQQIWRAEQAVFQDSFNLAINGNPVAGYPGFYDILDNYSGTEAANLANYYVGTAFMRTGDYDNALTFLGEFSGNDEMVYPMCKGLMGDAYVQKNDLENAIQHYDMAANASDNMYTAPMFLKKAGMALESQGKFAEAKERYERIRVEFPQAVESQDIDKYISFCAAKAGA